MRRLQSLCLFTTPIDNAELCCCSPGRRHYFPDGTSAQEERFTSALHSLDRFSPAALEAKCAEAEDVDHLIDLLQAAASPGTEQVLISEQVTASPGTAQVPNSEQVPSPSGCTTDLSLQSTEDSADEQMLDCACQSWSSAPGRQSVWSGGSVALVGRVAYDG